MDILLVLGNVNPEHYQIVLDAMVAEGLQPAVINIQGLSSEHEIGDQAIRELGINIDERPYIEYERDVTGKERIIKRRTLANAFNMIPLSNVKVIIHEDPDCADNVDARQASSSRWLWLKEQLPDNLPTYDVRIGNNGEPWLDGIGLQAIDNPANAEFADLYDD